MTDNEKIKFMTDIVNPIAAIIQERLDIQLNALDALTSAPLDNVPEAIQQMRESEAAKIRSVIKEQRELLSLIKIMYPTVTK